MFIDGDSCGYKKIPRPIEVYGKTTYCFGLSHLFWVILTYLNKIFLLN